MLFETFKSDGLAHLSYMIGGGGLCAVIDPRRDVEVYLQTARAHGLKITHIFETHIHADFVSGSRELAARTGARIHGGEIQNPNQVEYGFDIETLTDGDRVEVGPLRFRVMHTPGHSSEHVSYVVGGGGVGAEREWAVFTGDTLFAGEVGRPDLEPGADHAELAAMLFDSLELLVELDDGLEVLPCHGEGSPCGALIGARDRSTICYEREYNPRLRIEDEQQFVDTLMRELEESPAPAYYTRLKRTNLDGPKLLGALQEVQPLSAGELFEVFEDDDVVLLDTREVEAFAAAHVPGALHIALREAFPVWAGRMLAPNRDIIAIASTNEDIARIRTHLLRIGLDLHGYLAGGFRGWTEGGYEFARHDLMSVHQLNLRMARGEHELQIVDVRDRREWKQGHLAGARHIFVPQLEESIGRLDRERPVVTYCGSGFRASIAASLLEQHGFTKVYNVPGSMSAWRAAGFATRLG